MSNYEQYFNKDLHIEYLLKEITELKIYPFYET